MCIQYQRGFSLSNGKCLKCEDYDCKFCDKTGLKCFVCNSKNFNRNGCNKCSNLISVLNALMILN